MTLAISSFLYQIDGVPGVLEFLGVSFSVSLIDLNRDAVCVSQPCYDGQRPVKLYSS